MDVKVGPKERWELKNWCFWTFESPLDCREIQPVHPKGDQSWVFIGRTDVKAETPVLWPPDANLLRPWCWEKLKVGEKGDDRGGNGWMASPTQWTWLWVNSRRWWWTGKPGVLQSMGSQRVGHDWATELNRTDMLLKKKKTKTTTKKNPYLQGLSLLLVVLTEQASEDQVSHVPWDVEERFSISANKLLSP